MCTGVEIALLAGAAISAGAAIQQGNNAKKMGEYSAQVADADAAAEKGEAMVHAEKLRKAMRAQQSEARSALAASGVEVGVGTAELIEKDIYQRGEEDALSIILTGKRRAAALGSEAAVSRIRGGNEARAGNMTALGRAASGAATGWRAGGGWQNQTSTAGNVQTASPGQYNAYFRG